MNGLKMMSTFAACSCLALSAAADQHTYAPGQVSLAVNQPLSVSGLNLVLQTDGNIVAYAASGSVWASNTSSDCSGGNCSAVYQNDGNFVLYHEGSAVWSTQTFGHPDGRLVLSMQAPYFQITDAGATLWPLISAPNQALTPLPSQQVFAAGRLSLTQDQDVSLMNLSLVLQPDGNLVAYSPTGPVWATGVYADCRESCVASFQTDGNLVLYRKGLPYWSTGTFNHPGAQLVVSNMAPYLQVAETGKVLWPVTAAAPAPPPPASSCPALSCYYLDSLTGSDANSGNSPATAWKTFANVGSAAIAPGTSILLARGSTFNGQLTLKTSGTAANPVVVDAYGTGALPVIAGGTYGILGQSISYVIISNLAITNVADTGILGIGNKTEYWRVANCTITDAGTSGIQVRPDRTDADPLRGWVIQGNTIGTVHTAPALNYDTSGILVQGTAGALITRNTVTAVNTSGIRVQSYGSAHSQDALVSYNEVKMNQGGIAVRDTLNATVTHNWIHDGQGYAIGINGSENAQAVYTSYNNVLSYNLVQNMARSADGKLYNGFDITSSANGKIYHNTIEHVDSHSVSLEGDAGAANNWIVRNNIFDARRQGTIQDGNCFLFRLVDYTTEVLSNNLYMSNSNWLGIIGTDMDATTDLAIWYSPAWIALGIDSNSVYNQDVAFNDVPGENLGLQSVSYARNLGVILQGIDQVSLDAGALPYGQTNVLAF